MVWHKTIVSQNQFTQSKIQEIQDVFWILYQDCKKLLIIGTNVWQY